MRCGLLVAFVIGCGPSAAPPPVDYGPPAEPVDPIACPAARLEAFAARVGLAAEITTEPVLEAARVDKLPCKPDETDADCIARARKRPIPAPYEVAGVTIGAEVTHVEYTYEIDGRRVTEEAPTLAAMVERLKALQAAGHRITPIRAESAGDARARHAAIAYRAVGGQQRRVATLRGPAAAETAQTMADVHAAAQAANLELRSLQVTPDGELVVVATCIAL